MAYSLFSHRPFLIACLAYIAAFYSPLRNFCDFDLRIALGWADALRMFGATAAVVVTGTVLGHDGEAPHRSPRRWPLMGGGALAGLAVLYSQEFGLCAVGAVLLAPLAAHLFQHRGRGIGERSVATLQSLGWIILGIGAPLAAVMALYGCFGKATLLIATTYKTLSLTASGAFGSLEFPVSAKSFDQPEELLGPLFSLMDKLRDASIQLIVPVAIYIVALCSLVVRVVTRTWTASSTILFGLAAVGISSFRVALARAGVDHTLSASGPSILCLGILLDQSVDCCVYLYEEIRVPLGRMLAGALLVMVVMVTERIGGIAHQFEQIAHGPKVPPGQTAYFYRDLPRAGDAYLDEDFQAIARFVRETTSPTDKIFTLLHMMDGGELYFLCNRENPTRYDLLAEIMTADQQHEVLESLEQQPPRLIIGDDGSVVGPEVMAYVKKRWTISKSVGRYTVWLPP